MPNKILDDLIAHGVPSDTVIAVAKMIAAAETLDERRTRNRDRMREVRARANTESHVHAQENTETHTDSALSFLPSSQDKKPNEDKKERAKRDRGHVCPDDFRPSEGHFEAGRKKNIPPLRVEACCEAMKSWSKSNAHRAVARKVDWSAALFGWIEREAQRGKPNGYANGHGKRGVMEAAADLIDTVRGFDQPPPGNLFEPARAPNARLLSKG